MSLKFSLRSLLILIAVISVACAALANAGIWWHSIVVTATLAGMTGLLLWGTLHTGSRRAFACGWLLFAAGYLAIVFGPWTANHLGANLMTTKGLAQLEWKARGNNPSPPVLSFPSGLASDYNFNGAIDLDLVAPGTYSNNAVWTSYPSQSYFSTGDFGWSATASISTFKSTGHWLLASVFGYCGAHLAAFLTLRRRESTQD
ncbi:MAG: hypothetical protein ACR2FY_15970 [Pirellulaceae bacterium]